MKITATVESKAQVIRGWWTYDPNNSAWWSGVRLVAWISQVVKTEENTKKAYTTLKFKWQKNQYNYFPYWEDTHTYTVEFGGESRSKSFSLPQTQTNGVSDLSTVQSITVQHDSDGHYASSKIKMSGAYFWNTFSNDEEDIEFPDITIPDLIQPDPEPEPEEPDPPTPIEFDNDPRYYIYADGELIYSAGVEGYEIIDPKLTVEVNKAGSLTFEIPVGSAMYNKINKLKTTIEVRQGDEVLFRGRLLNTKRTMMNTISCYCEGFLSWLVDIVFIPEPFNGQARNLLKRYLERYNSRASDNRKITYKYSDISAKIKVDPEDHSNAWESIKKYLIDGVGGYIVPYLTAEETGIQWLSDYGATTSQIIEFGENLIDFSESIDASEIFTAVRPFGKETEVDGVKQRVSLSNPSFVYDQEAIDTFGRIERTVFFDEIETESALRAEALNYLRTGIQSAISLSISAIDMHLLDSSVERIRLGDAVRVKSKPHAVDAYFLCMKIVYDLGHPQNTRFTFGSTKRTISELTDSSYNKYVITEGSTEEGA